MKLNDPYSLDREANSAVASRIFDDLRLNEALLFQRFRQGAISGLAVGTVLGSVLTSIAIFIVA